MGSTGKFISLGTMVLDWFKQQTIQLLIDSPIGHRMGKNRSITPIGVEIMTYIPMILQGMKNGYRQTQQQMRLQIGHLMDNCWHLRPIGMAIWVFIQHLETNAEIAIDNPRGINVSVPLWVP